MKKIAQFVVLCLFVSIMSQTTFAQFKSDRMFEKKLKVLIDSFHGTVGIYVRNLKTGKETAISADTIFPTASILKIQILVGIFNKIDSGEFTYHQPLIYRNSIAHGGSGLIQYFKDSTKFELNIAITLMISHGDNKETRWCGKLAGGGVAH
jgi:beta-lactamase class A